MTIEHPWLPRASCDAGCVRAGAGAAAGQPVVVAWRVALRATFALLLLSATPLLAIPMPGRSHIQRGYCRLMLRCLGVRITVSGGPIRNLAGVLVVSGHVSWVDIFAIGAVMPGRFVARADLVDWIGLGMVARLMKVIPIDRASLRRLPDVVSTVADRLRAGQTVVAFPEGTTWCGLAYGPFRPAMFQAAVDAGRPVQPLRLGMINSDLGSGVSPPAARWCMCRSSRCSCPERPGGIWRPAARPRSAVTWRGEVTVTPWWPDLGIGTAVPWRLP